MKLNNTDTLKFVSNLTYLPRWGVMLLDALVIVVAFAISAAIGGVLFLQEDAKCILTWWQQAILILSSQILFCFLFRTHASILRYSTFVDIIKVLLAALSTSITWLIINNFVVVSGAHLFFNSILYTYFFVCTVLLSSMRIAIKTAFEFLSHQNSHTPVLIYGVKSAGLAIAKMIGTSPDSKYRVVGFISDETQDIRHKLNGLPVYKRDDHLISLMRLRHIQHVIVSPLKLKTLDPTTSLNLFLNNNITLLTASITAGLQSDDANRNQSQTIGSIESIRVEDLLERPVININTGNIEKMMKDNVILITGAAGSIGSEIVRQVSNYNPSVIVLFDIAESPLHDLSMDLRAAFPHQHYVRIIGDIRDLNVVENIFREYHPHIVFHAAAYKHVPLMEEFPQQAVMTNVIGTRNVADMAVKYGAYRFVMISTDKAVNPTNVMGASKRIAETYVQALNNKLCATSQDNNHTIFITTRFGNVLGSNGSVVPYFKKQIAKGGPVTVTHPDIIRYFMTIPEASCLVLEAATLGKGGEIFCFDMGHPVKIADLAKNMIRLAGYTPNKDIMIQYTGLRPGEKLYEELLNQRETTLPTPNEKIKIAKVREVDYDNLVTQIQALKNEAENGAVFPIVALMKQIVPEFISKNSIFEQLDKPK